MFIGTGCIVVDIVFIAGGAFRSNISNKLDGFCAGGCGFAGPLKSSIFLRVIEIQVDNVDRLLFFRFFLRIGHWGWFCLEIIKNGC